jgi:hypothetical protein
MTTHAWNVENDTVDQGGTAVASPPIGICAFIVGNLDFHGFPAI